MNVSSWVGVCFFFKQKTAYEMRISDWSSDVCSSDLIQLTKGPHSKDFSSDAILHQLFEKSQVIAMLLLTAHRGHRHDVGGRVDRRSMIDRKSVVSGKRVAVRVDLGGRRLIQTKR